MQIDSWTSKAKTYLCQAQWAFHLDQLGVWWEILTFALCSENNASYSCGLPFWLVKLCYCKTVRFNVVWGGSGLVEITTSWWILLGRHITPVCSIWLMLSTDDHLSFWWWCASEGCDLVASHFSVLLMHRCMIVESIYSIPFHPSSVSCRRFLVCRSSGMAGGLRHPFSVLLGRLAWWDSHIRGLWMQPVLEERDTGVCYFKSQATLIAGFPLIT